MKFNVPDTKYSTARNDQKIKCHGENAKGDVQHIFLECPFHIFNTIMHFKLTLIAITIKSYNVALSNEDIVIKFQN